MTGTRLYAISDSTNNTSHIGKGVHGRDKHKLRPPSPLIILFDDLDLSFTDAEVAIARKLYAKGAKYEQVAEVLGRDECECLLLGIHLVRGGEI